MHRAVVRKQKHTPSAVQKNKLKCTGLLYESRNTTPKAVQKNKFKCTGLLYESRNTHLRLCKRTNSNARAVVRKQKHDT